MMMAKRNLFKIQSKVLFAFDSIKKADAFHAGETTTGTITLTGTGISAMSKQVKNVTKGAGETARL